LPDDTYIFAITQKDFGKTVDQFEEDRFLKEYKNFPFDDWNGANWYPLVMDSRMWKLIGGLRAEFTPGMASDPDMMMKLWQAGERYLKGINPGWSYPNLSV
jgi:hypothetical protein